MSDGLMQGIGAQELLAYLDSASDFAFELSVLNLLSEKGCRCEHGGSYEDSVTRKPLSLPQTSSALRSLQLGCAPR